MNYNVRLYAQSYDYGCWLASTHMLNMYKVYSVNYPIELTSSVLLWGNEHWVNYETTWLGPNWGLKTDESTIANFSKANGLNHKYLGANYLPELREMIKKGPIMISGRLRTANIPSHFYIISDYDYNTGKVKILDPWPVHQGKISRTDLATFSDENPEAFYWAFWK